MLKRSEEFPAKELHYHACGQKVASPGFHPRAVLKAAVGREHVQVRVQRSGAPPGVQRRDEGRCGAQIARVFQQLDKHRAHRAEKKVRHARAVPAPQRVQLVRDGEDEMMVRAGDQACALALEPLLGGERLTLRAAALMARVVERALDVPLRTPAHVAAELGGAAARDPVRRAMHVRGQPMLLRVGLKMRLEYLSERAFHILRNARLRVYVYITAGRCTRSPGAAGLVQRSQ